MNAFRYSYRYELRIQLLSPIIAFLFGGCTNRRKPFYKCLIYGRQPEPSIHHNKVDIN